MPEESLEEKPADGAQGWSQGGMFQGVHHSLLVAMNFFKGPKLRPLFRGKEDVKVPFAFRQGRSTQSFLYRGWKVNSSKSSS